MMLRVVSTQLTRMSSSVHASNKVSSMSPTGYALGPPSHWLPVAFRLIHSAMGSLGLYPKRSRHLDKVPAAFVTLGQLASAPVGGISTATRRKAPRLHCDSSTVCPVVVE